MAVLEDRDHGFFLSTLQLLVQRLAGLLVCSSLPVYIGTTVAIDLGDGMTSRKGKGLVTRTYIQFLPLSLKSCGPSGKMFNLIKTVFAYL